MNPMPCGWKEEPEQISLSYTKGGQIGFGCSYNNEADMCIYDIWFQFIALNGMWSRAWQIFSVNWWHSNMQ